MSQNQQNVASALNNFFNTGGTLPPGFVSIFGLTGSNLGNALSQLSGEAATGGQQAGFQMGNQFLGMMLDPFVDGRNGAAGLGGPAIAFRTRARSRPRRSRPRLCRGAQGAAGAGAELRAALERMGRRLWRQQPHVAAIRR